MKKNIILLVYILCIFQFKISYSQIDANVVNSILGNANIKNRMEYEKYLKKIDSVMQYKIIVKNQEEIINKLVKFKIDSNKYIRSLVRNWLYFISIDKNNELNIRQLAAFHRIDMLYTSSKGIGDSYERMIYNKKIIRRMVELLKGMSKEEKQINIKSFIESDTANSYNKELVNKLQKKMKITNQEAWKIYIEKKTRYYDSLISKPLCNTYYDFPILIKTLGWLDAKECIPYLKTMLKDSNCTQNKKYKEAIYYALARMGNKEIEQKILQWDYFDFPYLNSKEAYFAFINTIKEADYTDWNVSLGDGKWPQSNTAITSIRIAIWNIANFPRNEIKLIDNIFKEEDKEIANMQAKKALQWILDNRDNIQLKDLIIINY